jgi:hypothetical protein
VQAGDAGADRCRDLRHAFRFAPANGELAAEGMRGAASESPIPDVPPITTMCSLAFGMTPS